MQIERLGEWNSCDALKIDFGVPPPSLITPFQVTIHVIQVCTYYRVEYGRILLVRESEVEGGVGG